MGEQDKLDIILAELMELKKRMKRETTQADTNSEVKILIDRYDGKFNEIQTMIDEIRASMQVSREIINDLPDEEKKQGFSLYNFLTQW